MGDSVKENVQMKNRFLGSLDVDLAVGRLKELRQEASDRNDCNAVIAIEASVESLREVIVLEEENADLIKALEELVRACEYGPSSEGVGAPGDEQFDALDFAVDVLGKAKAKIKERMTPTEE